MSNDISKIAQLVDHELTSAEQSQVFDLLIKNKQAAKKWQRYHLIGNIMRDDIHQSGNDMSESIAAALELEPTVLSPNRFSNQVSDQISNQASDEKTSSDLWKPVGLFAMAASLAVVAVVALNPVNDQITDQQNTRFAALDENQVETQVQTQVQTDQSVLSAQEFDEMLVEHGEFTSSSGLNGLLSYAKLVSSQSLDQ